ncbi:MAG: LEA type 2 family protein [Chromatiales bacterium]|jgi:LEA14-like dessication related protein
MLRTLLLITVLVQLLLLSGCATLEQVGQALEGQRPTAKVAGLKLTGLDMNGVDLTFDVQVDNPNPVGISLAGFDYDLKLLGSSFLQGNQTMGMKLSANGSSQVQVPVRLGFQQLLNSYRQLKGAEQVGYQLDLGMGFEVPLLGEVRVPVSHQGEFPIPEMPAVSLRSLDVQQLTLSGARLLLELEVDNPNSFSLLLNKLNYHLKLNGYDVGGGLVDKQVKVQQEGQGRLSLPLNLDFAQAGRGLYSALLGSGIRYDLSGSMEAASSNSMLAPFRIPLDKQGSVDLR